MSSMKELRDFIDTVSQIGWEFIGFDGRSHPRFRHTVTGDYYSTGLTPSDYNSRRNCLSDMERICGQKLPRQKSGKHRFKPVEKTQMRRARSEDKALGWVNDMDRESQELARCWRELTQDPSNADIQEARRILSRYETIRVTLARHHRMIPTIDNA